MREFRINKYLSVRLEEEETIIYVAQARFKQCAFLVLNINIEEISSFDEIESIDDAVEKLDLSLEFSTKKYELGISPEVEFWGHCSNLQVWYEHDYDTRLIHSNLAFPLLKKLTEVGDPLAKRVFREEIIKRFEKGAKTTREFLKIEKYLDFLPVDEKLHLILNNDDFSALFDLSEEILPFVIGDTWVEYPIAQFISNLIESGHIKIRHGQVTDLNLWNLKIKLFPKSILKFKSLEVLNLQNNKLEEIPENIDKLVNVKKLSLFNNNLIYLPDSICNLKKLEHISLSKNNIESLPNNIGNLTELRNLWLSSNSLVSLPESTCKLKKLKDLLLCNNLLKELPQCLVELDSLRNISLKKNKFGKDPEVLKKIENLIKEIKTVLKKNNKLLGTSN